MTTNRKVSFEKNTIRPYIVYCNSLFKEFYMSMKLNIRKIIALAVVMIFISVAIGGGTSTQAAPPQQSSQVIESDDASVTQTGNWTSQSTASASGGSYLYSSGAETDTLTLNFTGTAIEIGYVEGPAFGDFAIEIDNNIVRSVVTTETEINFDARAVVDYLDNETHTLRIIPVEGAIAIDAFYSVLASASQRTPASPIFELAAVSGDNLWPNAEINYQFDAAVSATNRNTLRDRMDEWEAVAPVTFIHCPGDACAQQPYLSVENASENYATIGSVTHPLYVNKLAFSSAGWDNDGIILHQLAHVLGLRNEQQRPDRNTYITVNTANIIPGKAFEYEIVPDAETYGPYDFNSLMHFGECAWSIAETEGCHPTMRTIQTTAAYASNQSILYESQATDISDYDAEEMRHLYSGAIPSAPTLTSPTGNIYYVTPSIIWDTVPNGTLYSLQITNAASAVVVDQNLTTVELGCAGGGTCTFEVTTALPIGCYDVTLQALNKNNSSPVHTNNFCVVTPPPATAVTLVGPLSDLPINPLTFFWDSSTYTTWFRLYISKVGENFIIDNWYTAEEVGCTDGIGSCSIALPTIFPPGTYSWWVQSYNGSGVSPWSAAGTFQELIGTAPGQPSFLSPSPGTTINTYTPTLLWITSGQTEWQQIWLGVAGSAPDLDTGYYSTELGCATGAVCALEIPPNTLANNTTYTWYVRSWNSIGFGPWTGSGTFTTNVFVPTTPTQIYPLTTVDVPLPTYTWSPASGPGMNIYQFILVYPSGSNVILTYSPQQLGCSNGGTCSITPFYFIEQAGTYQWWIRAGTDTDWGAWVGQSFTYVPPAASPVTLVSPAASSTITNPTPPYEWDADPYANWYQLEIAPTNSLSTPVYSDWYHLDTAGCPYSTGTCSITPNFPLAVGNYSWRVRAYTLNGMVWSPYNDFSVANASSFNSQFNGDATNWEVVNGIWTAAASWYQTFPAINHSWSSAYYDAYYANFDYTARVQQSVCDTCPGGVIVRGLASPVQPGSQWNTGYWFTYTRNGYFIITRLNGSSAPTELVAPTFSSAIVQGNEWNELRVVANGSSLTFYINNVQVASLTDSTYLAGNVGIGIHRIATSGDIYADWATLTVN